MKILVISPFVPWPLDAGGKIRIFNLVKELSARHEVTLACLSAEPVAVPDELHSLCAELLVELRPVSLFRDLAGFILGDQPFNVRRFYSPRFADLLASLYERNRYDVVILEFSFMWQYARPFPSERLVLDAHNIESSLIRQLRGGCGNLLKRVLYGVEEKRMAGVEMEAWRGCRLCLAVSDAERLEIIGSGVPPERVVTVANGVDPERFAVSPRQGGKRVLFLGGLDYYPNRDAAEWLLQEIWPMIREADPEAELLLAGRRTDELLRSGAPQGVVCLGDPDDVPSCLAGADMLLVPLRIGAGTRLKVLEAMAAGLPVVATSRGVEGIGASPGEHLLVADGAGEFAAACLRLLSDVEFGGRLAASSRKLVEERYSWQAVMRPLLGALELAEEERGGHVS